MTTLVEIFAATGILAGAYSPLGAPAIQLPATWSVAKGLPVMLTIASWQGGQPEDLPPFPSNPPPLGGANVSFGASGAMRVEITNLITGTVCIGEFPTTLSFAVSGAAT